MFERSSLNFVRRAWKDRQWRIKSPRKGKIRSMAAGACWRISTKKLRIHSKSPKPGPRKVATKVVLVNGVMKKLLLFLSYDFKTQVMKHFLPHLLKGPQTLAVKVVLKLFPSPSSEGVIPSSPSLKVFYFKDLKKATRNFGCDSILGEGGCGRVFKGWLDKHTLSAFKPAFGMVVAIKKDKPKGFLDRNEWLEFNPKLLASRLARKDHCIEDAYTTFMDYCEVGYMPSEWCPAGWLSAKSNVYSFGVVLLELLSGRPVIDRNRASVEQNLVVWLKPYLGDKEKLFYVMDHRLEGQYPKKEASVAAALALRCLSTKSQDRPTMAEALTILEQISDPNNTSNQSQ